MIEMLLFVALYLSIQVNVLLSQFCFALVDFLHDAFGCSPFSVYNSSQGMRPAQLHSA